KVRDILLCLVVYGLKPRSPRAEQEPLVLRTLVAAINYLAETCFDTSNAILLLAFSIMQKALFGQRAPFKGAIRLCTFIRMLEKSKCLMGLTSTLSTDK